jgi:hypothetical protein
MKKKINCIDECILKDTNQNTFLRIKKLSLFFDKLNINNFYFYFFFFIRYEIDTSKLLYYIIFKTRRQKSYIYCIKSLNSNLIYIGSTKQSLASRKAKHIYDSKKEHRIKPVHRITNANGGFNNFQIK